ncbi:MAG: geranylgeranyl reductase family protein [Actinomycetota bacterium]|nr:geranylgeranyl reductase family protein [Actinomycetota bacterium]
MPEAVDLLVVGGGPAGAAAAITAAGAGLSVLVCDKSTFPRDKTCGDGLTADALRRLEAFGLVPSDVKGFTPVTDVVVRSPSGRIVELPLPADGLYAAVAPRASLDTALFDLAGRQGAELRPGVALERLDQDDGGVRAHLADGSHPTASYLVAADGVYSTVRKLVAPAPEAYLGEWHAFRQYFTGVDDPRLWVVFERDLLPGYTWVFPLGDGRANVGFGVPRRPGVSVRPMAAVWRDLPQRPALRQVLGDAVAEGTHRAWPIPADLGRAPLSVGRVLFVGDAAGATDPMTGEGIAQALVTGALAAEAVAAAGDPAGVARRYATAVERHLGPDLRFAARLGRILRSPLGARAAVRAADLSGWTRRNFARWLFEDYPRALLLTPTRWHRGAMSGAGAYGDE